MAESSGELLGGRYRLLGERTSFPFGAWWEAEDDQGARTVVLRMNPEVAEPAAKAAAAVAASAKLDSAHIVAWAAGGVDAMGHGWLAAPMFGPWSLNEHVSKGEGVPPSEAATLMHQLARAMAAAEAQGVQHNTLSSEFVRLVPLSEGGYGVKVYGFGLADLLPSYKPLRKQDAYLGVPDYMSPELCSGKVAEGSSADIYAVGILMYEAVRGRPPFAPTFASASASTTLKRHIFEKPLPLHVRYANAPFIKTYETIAFKALAKTANRRHLSLGELEKELEQLIVDEMRSQIVSLDAVSGRGPTTSRRLRTQVIAQIPIDEQPKVEVKVAPPVATPVEIAKPAEPAPVTVVSKTVASQPVAVVAAPVAKVVEPAEAKVEVAARVVAAEPVPEPEDDDEVSAPVETASASSRRVESTMVFAGLGPAVREMAEAARNADEDDDGSTEDEALPAGAASSQPRKGKKKKGRKHSTGVTGVSPVASTQQALERPEPKPVAATTPSAATIMTAKAESPTGETAGAAAAASAEASGARIRKKDDALAVKPKAVAAKGKDEEEWFGDDDAKAKKGTKAWIFLLLAAVVVIIVVVMLMSSGDKSNADLPVGVTPGTPAGQRYAMESEPGNTGSEAAPTPKPSDPSPTLTASGATATTPVAPAVVEVEAAKPEPAKVEAPKPAAVVEAPKPEPAKVEAPKPEPAKVEAPKPAAVVEKVASPEPAKIEARKEPTKVEPAKVEKVAEPAKVEKVAEPAKVEKTDAPGSPEDQFRQKAQHYIQLGMQAYKSENYKLAIGYFKKAQEADPNNILAARYLKQAMDKTGP